MTARKKITPAQRAEILDRQDHHCPECTMPIHEYEDTDNDHRIPLELGGKDVISNIDVLHRTPCHRGRKSKTSRDIKRIWKAKRNAAKQAAHEEARRSGTRAPSKKQQRLARWKENQPEPIARRQD